MTPTSIEFLLSRIEVLERRLAAVDQRMEGAAEDHSDTPDRYKQSEIEHENALQLLFDDAPFAIAILIGRELTFLYANNPHLEIHSKSASEIIGKTLDEVMPEAVVQGYKSICLDVLSTGIPYVQIEAPITYLRSGHIRHAWYDVTIQPKYDKDKINIVGVYTFSVDATEKVLSRKKIEEGSIKNSILAAIVFYSEDAIVSKTLDGIVTSWNPGAEKLFGFSAEEMVGQSITKIIPADRINEEPKILQRIQQGEFVSHFETQRLTKSGALVDISLTISPVKNGEGEIVGASKIARNITEAKIAKQKLVERENQLRLLKDELDLSIRAGKIGVWNYDFKTNDVHWSKEQCELFGISEDEFDNTMEAFWKFVFPDDLSRLQNESTKNIKLQVIDSTQQYRILRKDGEERWIESRTRTQYDSTGRPQFITGISIDITEDKLFTKQLEQKVAKRTLEINKQKEFIETIFNSTPDLIIGYDVDLRIVTFSKSCEMMFNVKREDVLGKKYLEIFPASVGTQGESDLHRALQGETIHNAEYYSPVTEKYYENFVSPLHDESGKIYAVIVIAHDITERLHHLQYIKQSEEKFNKLFSASPLGLVLSEYPSGRTIDTNQTLLDLVEYSRDEYIGKTPIELTLFSPEEHAQMLQQLLTLGHIKNIEMEITTKTGKRIPVINSVEKITIGDKEYFLSAVIDITDRKKNEKQIQQANIELQRMNKELEAFTYISSHDLQEPLRKIQMFAGRIIATEKEQLSGTAKEYLNRMNIAASRMQTLIQDLLNFSRLTNSERSMENADLQTLLDEVKNELKEVIEAKNVTIESHGLCAIDIIPFQFRQLITNLISNAIKFSKPDEPPHIIITCVKATGKELDNKDLIPSKSYFYITFKDNGIGFEKHFTEKIFEVFQKLHGRDQYPGTGIGLAIVKKIVDNHNGLIVAESEIGKGATFHIYLPE